MDRKNPTSPIRTGFDYQDTWALYLCALWLCEPKKFKWKRFETIPDEVPDKVFFLDDIVLCTQNDSYHLFQIKYKQNPNVDLWSWEALLEKETGSTGKHKDSLIQKWFKSYSKPSLKGKIEYAALVTNGDATEDIKKYINDHKINVEKVKTEIPEIYLRLEEQFNNEAELLDFFSNFKFLFGQKDIQALEDEARKILYEKSKVTKIGADNLLTWIHKECRKQYTTEISLEKIIEWCEFDIPRPLNENFIVPEDFELFDKAVHDKIVTDLQSEAGGIKVIFGKPGSGKSTYISKLIQVLRSKDIISIRHHYHISPDEPNPLERLQSSRVEEAIKAQFKEHSEELEDLAYQNSGNVPIQKYISKLASYFSQQGKAFVIFIDGLDHVLRYGGKSELKTLISEICFPQPGLWIVFGTQEAAKEYLPQIVFDKCPEEEWIEIKGLGQEAVTNIVKKNLTGLNLPKENPWANEIFNKIIEITLGNPLHLRYTLKQLKATSGEKLINTFQCANLVPYGKDISQYYDSLWRILPEPGKTIALIISSVGFRFTEEHLFDLLSSIEIDPPKISEGYKSIIHLLSIDRRGISVFHSSFQSFMAAQREFGQQKKSINTKIKDWLESSKYEELKWAELKNLYYCLGNPEPILGLSMDWAIDAICYPHDPQQAISQLKLGAKAAFENKNFGKAFELSNLSERYKQAIEYVQEEHEQVWEEAFIFGNLDLAGIDLDKLSPKQIQIVIQKADRMGIPYLIDDAMDRFHTMHSSLEFMRKGEIGSQIPQLPTSFISVVTLDRKHEVKRVHKYIKQFEKSGWAEDLFAIYAEVMLKSGQFLKIEELLELEITPDAKKAILDQCGKHDLEYSENRFIDIIFRQDHKSLSNFGLIYLLLKGKSINFTPSLPGHELYPEKVPEYETGKRNERAQIFSENYILGIIYGLTERESEVQSWIAQIEPRWALEIMSQIFTSSLVLARQIKEHNNISISDIFLNLAHVNPLQWSEHRDLYELQICLHTSISFILKYLLLLKCATGSKIELDTKEMEQIIGGSYFDRENLLQYLLDIKVPLLSKETYEQYVTDEKGKWKKLVTNFPERAGHYIDLAKLSAIHKDNSNRELFLKLAARNLLGYGYHKDMYLDGVLQSIEVCHKAGSRKTGDWIRKIAPIVENVTEYTDGDETAHLPKYLGEVLSITDSVLLRKYYFGKSQNEELYLAESIFRFVIRSLSFSENEDIALATTALDVDSFEELKSLSKTNSNANKALTIIEDYFGHVEFPSKQYSTPSPSLEKPAIDYSLVKPSDLVKHMETFKNRWDERDFLVQWSNIWLHKDGIDINDIYLELSKLIERDELFNAESELLDILYPLAYEYDDNNKAFEYLCWAQANDNGWELYWTDKRKANQRWDYVQKYYAERCMDFFEKSIVYSGTKYGRGGKYSISIPRSIEFLALFGKLREMEDITEASIKFAQSMMGDIDLPTCKWIGLPNIDNVDILLSRLIWPSPLVRERAATGIAELLQVASNRENILDRLVRWINKQKLESIVAIGLLPLLKAAEKHGEKLGYINTDKLATIIPFTSIVIEQLIKELSRLLNKPISLEVKRIDINIVPATYCTSDFFIKHISSFLAPIYYIRAEKIEKITLKNFSKQWAYTSEQIMKDLDLEENRKVLDFMGGYHEPSMPGMSTILSEVYRSAFLRVLQHYRDKEFIDNYIYLEDAYATLPIELSYWKVKPGRAPIWWPKLLDEIKTEKDTLQKISFERGIDQILDSKEEFKVIGLDGAVEPGKGWAAETPITSITLLAFGYRVTGPEIPEAKKVADKILYLPFKILEPTTDLPFNFLEASRSHIIVGESSIKINDLIIYPLAIRYRDLVIALWQWFRDRLMPFGLAKEFDDKLTVEIKDRTWEYVKNGHTVARSGNWLEGIKEKHDKDLQIPCGNYIEADPSLIDSYLKTNRLRIGYVEKITYTYKEDAYVEAKSMEAYRLLRVSRLII